MRHYDLQARKSLGQHFLIDREVLNLITTAAELSVEDTVLEVGPGLGVLTRELAEHCGRVVAVELDDKLAEILRQTLAPCKNITITNSDILQTTPAALLIKSGLISETTPAGSFPYKVVANLPYYITSLVLRHFLEAKLKPHIMVLMVQKEVADVITAEPGRMSLLSVSVRFYGEPSLVSYVPAGCFYPAPEVDSAVVKIRLYPEPLPVTEVDGFFNLVRAGFSAPRKQIANSMSRGLGWNKENVLPLLEQADVLPKRRAQTLSINEWQKLWQIFSKVDGCVNSKSTG